MKFRILLILLYVAQCVQAQTGFTEEEFLSVVKKFHPVAAQASLQVAIAEAAITSSRGKFDPVLSLNDDRKELEGSTYYKQQSNSIKIPTWYGIDVYAGTEKVNGEFFNPEKTKGSISYVGFSVPVVQNLVMDKRRAVLQQAKLVQQQTALERKLVLNNLLLDAAKAYWNWWEQYHVYQLVQSSLANASQRLQWVKTAWQLGDRPAIDTLEAWTQVQSFAQKSSEAYVDWQQSVLEMNNFLWKENNEPYELPQNIVPQMKVMNNAPPIDSLLQRTASHPQLLQYNIKLKLLQIDKQLKFQSLLPDVDLKYNQLGKGQDFGKTFSNGWFSNNYKYGLSVSVPLRLSEGRGDYKQAKLKIEQTRLEQGFKTVQLNNKLKQYYIEWLQLNQQYNTQQQLLRNIVTLQKGEETRFKNGESSLFLINARELKTLETEQKLIGLQGKLQKSMRQVLWATGAVE